MSTANDIAKSSAETQRELAEINQQQQRIVTFEKAQVQFQERNNLLLKTESELHSMILRAERLKLNILMAEQREDMERAELSRLYGRVSFLLQEWGRANHFVANNPINRPDYRLIRDILMRDADEAFAYAQERCYLAAKAAEYRVNFDPNSLSNEINTAIKNIIKARWAKNLLTALDSLNDYIEDLQIRQSGRQTDSITLSLRHFIFQNNYIINNSTNNSTTDYPDPNQSVFETQVDENGNIINSDDAWKAFLKAHLTFDPDIKADKLEFIFSTSLNRPNAASGLTYKKNNPLHIPNSTGMLLSWTRDKFSAEWRYHQYPGQTIEHSFG
ncbi:MAG: hypothetical protein BWK80_57150 [Desulfobacteraceae bacterium IS3]|nr:MAG: hypothetical protein BWK80_57150 [Desulfobacteraceae bacterium IS3]